MTTPPMKKMSPKDWLTKRNKNKQVNTSQHTRFGQARRRGFATGAKSKYAAKMASAGQSVKAKAQKDPPTPLEKEKPSAHSDPTGRTGWNTAYNTPGDYDKAIKHQQTETAKVAKPTKSGFEKFLKKSKGSLLKKIGKRRYNVL